MAGDKSWEGQAFTLVIFGGGVILCSVFFVLGMLAGRSQARTVIDADIMDAESEMLLTGASEEPDLTFYESVAEQELPGLEVSLDSSFPASPTILEDTDPFSNVEPDIVSNSLPAVPPSGQSAVVLQVVALSNGEQARSLSEELVEKGFDAFVLVPGLDDPDALNRVQVGPITDDGEVERVRAALEAEGHNPIVVR